MTKRAAGQVVQPHVQLAVYYCTNILGRQLNIANDKWLLKQASDVVKAAKEINVSLIEVESLLIQLHFVGHEFTDYTPWNDWADQLKASQKWAPDKPVSLHHLIYLKPKGRTDTNLLQWALEIPEPPSVYDAFGMAEWVRQYGKRALEQGRWNGIVDYPPFHDPNGQPLKPSELAELIGREYADKSLAKLLDLENKLGLKTKLASS